MIEFGELCPSKAGKKYGVSNQIIERISISNPNLAPVCYRLPTFIAEEEKGRLTML